MQKLHQYVAQQKTVINRRTQDMVPEQINDTADRQYKSGTTILREGIGRDFMVLQTNLLKLRQEIENDHRTKRRPRPPKSSTGKFLTYNEDSVIG